jgi:tetratricopeptide repeat protein 21B
MVLKENNKHFNALLGSAKYRELRGDHSGAIIILNPLIIRYPKLSIPLVEKINNLLALKEWEQVVESSNRILLFENSNIDAFKLKTLVVICKEGSYNEAIKYVQTFFRNLMLAEPKNINLFIDNLELFSKIAVKDAVILAELFKFTEKMHQQNVGINVFF